MKNYLQETPNVKLFNKSIQELIERKGWKQYCFKYHPCDCDCSVCGFGVQIIWYFFGVQ